MSCACETDTLKPGVGDVSHYETHRGNCKGRGPLP